MNKVFNDTRAVSTPVALDGGAVVPPGEVLVAALSLPHPDVEPRGPLHVGHRPQLRPLHQLHLQLQVAAARHSAAVTSHAVTKLSSEWMGSCNISLRVLSQSILSYRVLGRDKR